MEAIKTYLDNVFAAFEQTERVTAIKRDMLEGMEEKYHELKLEGKSEHEAIGSVISNFGSIDEIAAELGGMQAAAEPDESIILSRDEAYDYIAQTKKISMGLGIGVWLVMAGICALLIIANPQGLSNNTADEAAGNNILNNIGYTFQGAIDGIFESGDTDGNPSSAFGVFALFAALALAVPLFIVNGIRYTRFENYHERYIKLDTVTRADLEEQRTRFTTRFAVQLSAGVAIILIAVGTMLILSSLGYTVYPVVMLLFAIGFSALIFIMTGMLYTAYDILLSRGDYSWKQKQGKPELKTGDRIIGTIAATYWPLVTAAYLLVSFLSGAWHISWVIWPVAGILFGAIAGGIGAWYGTRSKAG